MINKILYAISTASLKLDFIGVNPPLYNFFDKLIIHHLNINSNI